MELQVIPKSMSLHNIKGASEMLVDNLLAEHDTPTAYVIVKQLLTLAELSLEQLKEKAIIGLRGKDILGAELSISYRKSYEYDSVALAKLINDEQELRSKIKNLKKQLELAGVEGLVNQSTGAIEKATLLKETGILVTKFKDTFE